MPSLKALKKKKNHSAYYPRFNNGRIFQKSGKTQRG